MKTFRSYLDRQGLSLILVGRNDNHGGNFEDRLFTALEHNSALLRRAGIPHEFIWMEWNPLAGRPLLADEVVRRIPQARAFIASPALHRAVCRNPRMNLEEFFAKNAGIRRARHGCILTTNADILLDAPLVEALRAISPGEWHSSVFRAVRMDLKAGIRPSGIGKPGNLRTARLTTPPYHAEVSGDFILATREVFEALRGFNEVRRDSMIHKDSQFCMQAYQAGFAVKLVGKVYHLYHDNTWIYLPLAERNRQDATWGKPYDFEAELPYVNGDDWGLHHSRARKIRPRVFSLAVPRRRARPPCGPASAGPLAEASLVREAAFHLPETEFRGVYLDGLARLAKARAGESRRDAIAFLRRYIQVQWGALAKDAQCGKKGVAVYGVGRHTLWMLKLLRKQDGPRIACFLDDFAGEKQRFQGLPVLKPEDLDPATVGAVVISSDIYENKMAVRCRRLFGVLPVVTFYDGLPKGLFLQDQR